MSARAPAERVSDVRRLVGAAQALYDQRARWSSQIAESTGLSSEGVELGFSCLERNASDGDLRELLASAGDADRIHVVMSSNVFVAPLRALAIARAAARSVTIRPSPRDPTLTRALVETAADESVAIVDERDVVRVDATEIHVYGRDETIAAVRARARTGVIVRGHGAGLGVAIVTRSANVEAAAGAIATDVVPFDQRGCLSPRVVLIEGSAPRAEALARSLHENLTAMGGRVPRGSLLEHERAEARRWADALSFVGTVWTGEQHAVAWTPRGVPVALGPPGRHVLVLPVDSLDEASAHLAPFARFVVAVGSDDPVLTRAIAPMHARVSALGRMQKPPLDGPVDYRALHATRL